MKIGANTFGLAFKMYDDFDGTLKKLKDAGVTSIEPCIDFENHENRDAVPEFILKKIGGGVWDRTAAADRIRNVRKSGFQVISSHLMVTGITSPDELDKMKDEILRIGLENGIKYFVIGLKADPSVMREYAPALEHLAVCLKENGIALCYHNEEMEFAADEHGKKALDILFEEASDIKLELDVGWAMFAGEDAEALMEKYKDRLELIHLKDIMEGATAENRNSCCEAVGEGALPLERILRKASELGLGEETIIIDQDSSKTDILDDIAIGVKNCSRCL